MYFYREFTLLFKMLCRVVTKTWFVFENIIMTKQLWYKKNPQKAHVNFGSG